MIILTLGRIPVLLAVLVSAAAGADERSRCHLVRAAALQINFVKMLPTVTADFDGIPLTMLVDSGAQMTMLLQSGVEKAHLIEGHINMETAGIGGVSQSHRVIARNVVIGPSHAGHVELLVADDSNTGTDGLVGADFLFRMDLEIVLKDNQINYLAPVDCDDDDDLGYWSRDSQWVEAETSGFQDRRQIVPVSINGRKFRAMLDTGASQSVLDLGAAAKLGLTATSPEMQQVGTTGGIGKSHVSTWSARFDSFVLGEETIKNPRILVADLWGKALHDRPNLATRQFAADRPDMLLGADFMRAHHLLFALSQHRLYFSYSGGPVFRLDESR